MRLHELLGSIYEIDNPRNVGTDLPGIPQEEADAILDDKLSRTKPDMRKKRPVAMPGNSSTYPAL